MVSEFHSSKSWIKLSVETTSVNAIAFEKVAMENWKLWVITNFAALCFAYSLSRSKDQLSFVLSVVYRLSVTQVIRG